MFIKEFPVHDVYRSMWVPDPSIRPGFPGLGQTIGLGYQGISDNSVASLGFGTRSRTKKSKSKPKKKASYGSVKKRKRELKKGKDKTKDKRQKTKNKKPR